MEYKKEAKLLVKASHQLADRGLTTAAGGNLSYRTDDGHFLITPSGVAKNTLEPEDICILDMDGNLVYAKEGRKPSSETPFHAMILKKRPEVNCVVHAHSKTLCAFSMIEKPWLATPYLAEQMLDFGPIITVPYALPRGEALSDKIEPYVYDADAFLLANHGPLLISRKDPIDGVERMEALEAVAASIYMALSLGGVKAFTDEEAQALNEMRRDIIG